MDQEKQVWNGERRSENDVDLILESLSLDNYGQFFSFLGLLKSTGNAI